MAQNARSGKITKRVVDSLAPEDARYTPWDTQLKGFGVRVATTDIKTYVVRYRTTGGADRLLHIARHGVVTAEEARERQRRFWRTSQRVAIRKAPRSRGARS